MFWNLNRVTVSTTVYSQYPANCKLLKKKNWKHSFLTFVHFLGSQTRKITNDLQNKKKKQKQKQNTRTNCITFSDSTAGAAIISAGSNIQQILNLLRKKKTENVFFFKIPTFSRPNKENHKWCLKKNNNNTRTQSEYLLWIYGWSCNH